MNRIPFLSTDREEEMLHLILVAVLLLSASGCVTDAIHKDVHNLQNDLHRL
jgi:hypothetical protein